VHDAKANEAAIDDSEDPGPEVVDDDNEEEEHIVTSLKSILSGGAFME
jgi:hypothetical protein